MLQISYNIDVIILVALIYKKYDIFYKKSTNFLSLEIILIYWFGTQSIISYYVEKSCAA